MATNFIAQKATIGEVYIQPSHKFRIPRFQRQYAWEEKDIEEFWETINSDKPVFLGTIIFDVREKLTSKIVEIVDGQQRYLTIQILAAAVRNLILADGKANKEPDYINKARGINRLIIGSTDVYDDNLYDNYLETGDSIKDFFKTHIQNNPPEEITEVLKVKKNSEEEKVKKAYLKLKELVSGETVNMTFSEKFQWAKNLLDVKLARHFFVKIEIDEENLAYEIFETVNAKGVDLSVADLIKNQVFRNVIGPDDKNLDSAKEQWNTILDALSGTDFSLKEYLSYYWTSRYDYIPDKKLYSAIRDKMKSQKDWKDFLKDLVTNAGYLNLILNGGFEEILQFFGNDRTEALRAYNSLRILRATKAKTWIILWLCLFRNLDSENPFIIPFKIGKRWEILQKFTFLYFQILGMPGNWYFKLISEFCKKIESFIKSKASSKDFSNLFVNSLYTDFVTQMPAYFDNFNDGFKTIEYKDDAKSRVIIRYVLNELEEKIGGSGTEGYNEEKVSIEHLLPREPSQWKVSKKLIKPYVNTLGNLTIISKELNGKLENKKIDEKLTLIKAAEPSIRMVREIVKNIDDLTWDFDRIRSDRDFDAIEKRTTHLSKFGFQIWNEDLRNKMGF